MQVVGLIGYMDKYDFAINLAKALYSMEKSVIVVDATLDRKLKFVVPALSNVGRSYITQYNNIDFAVGFDSMHDVENYMSEQGINISLYDCMLIDIDSPKSYEFFRSRGIDKKYFFIDTSVLSIAKNKDIIKAIRVYNQSEENVKLTKVLYKGIMSRAAEDYFKNAIIDYSVDWQEPEYEIMQDDMDKVVDIDSQYSGIIDLKKHTKQYLENLAQITAQIIGEPSYKNVIKEIKRRRD